MSKIIKDDDYCVSCGEYCGTSTMICAKCKKDAEPGMKNLAFMMKQVGISVEECETAIKNYVKLRAETEKRQ